VRAANCQAIRHTVTLPKQRLSFAVFAAWRLPASPAEQLYFYTFDFAVNAIGLAQSYCVDGFAQKLKL
jgi:hypothetical protein